MSFSPQDSGGKCVVPFLPDNRRQYHSFRPHRTQTRGVVCVCLYVCLCVGHAGVLCKNGWNDRDAVWGLRADSCGSTELCIRWHSRSDESIRSPEGWHDTMRPLPNFSRHLFVFCLNTDRFARYMPYVDRILPSSWHWQNVATCQRCQQPLETVSATARATSIIFRLTPWFMLSAKCSNEISAVRFPLFNCSLTVAPFNSSCSTI